MATDDVITQAKSWGYHVENCCGGTGLKGALGRGGDANAVDKDTKNAMTALMHASSNGHLDKVQALIAAGAKIATQDKGGRTALHYAAVMGHAEVVSALLAADAAAAKVKDKDKVSAAALAKAVGFSDVAKLIKAK